MIQLTAGPRGGQNYGDGWWEGQCSVSCVEPLDTLRRLMSLRLLVSCRDLFLFLIDPVTSSSVSCIRFDAFVCTTFASCRTTDTLDRDRREREERDLSKQLCAFGRPLQGVGGSLTRALRSCWLDYRRCLGDRLDR